jgi:secreted trypsin-like serine protease
MIKKQSLWLLSVAMMVLLASCSGVTPPSQTLEPEIVGGVQAVPNEFPFMVHLDDSFGQFCGGSVVDEQWILTAGHCVFGASASSVSIVAGDHTLNDSTGREQKRRVSKIVMHPNYRSSDLNYDVALLKLSRPLTFNQYVAPVTLAAVPATGRAVQVVGWGALRSGGSSPTKLRKAQVNIYDFVTCQNVYKPLGISLRVTNTMFCASTPQFDKDTCQGDSGGPIFFKANNEWRQVGLTSKGEGCAQRPYPGVYTNVVGEGIEQWIPNTIAAN